MHYKVKFSVYHPLIHSPLWKFMYIFRFFALVVPSSLPLGCDLKRAFGACFLCACTHFCLLLSLLSCLTPLRSEELFNVSAALKCVYWRNVIIWLFKSKSQHLVSVSKIRFESSTDEQEMSFHRGISNCWHCCLCTWISNVGICLTSYFYFL